MDFFQCISLAQAQEMIRISLIGKTVGCEEVFLPEALGRITAVDIMSGEELPPFSRSTVDGFAVRSADTFGATETSPALFSLVGEVLMGEAVVQELLPGQAVAIPTGGMLPKKADAVVMFEYTEKPDGQTLLVQRMAAPGENVIHRGEDLGLGKVIVPQGQKLTPQQLGLLAACGCEKVPVRQKVKAAVISTGDELVDINGIPAGGQMRDINSYALGARLEQMGCAVQRLGIVKDNYDAFYTKLTQAAACADIVVISGGSSVGTRDYTVRAIEAAGRHEVMFHGIAIKPGKPTIFGMVGAVPVFGLPGHPVAAMTVCEHLVKPAVRILSCQEVQKEFYLSARISRNVASAPGRDDFISVRLEKRGGEYIAVPIMGKSGLIRLMAEADGMLHIHADQSGLYEGDVAEVLLLHQEGE